MKKTFLDLGMQPLANNFSKKYIPPLFRLKLKFDTNSKLVMINKHMKKEKMFDKSYPYRSSKSKLVNKLFKELSEKIKKKLKPENILEIGSNDGTFASNFDKKKITCIEPCGDVAIEAKKKGLKVYVKYFDDLLVKKLLKDHKKFDMIFSANTITHISDYNSVFSNLFQILSDTGTLIIEEPSLLETIKKNSYDQFYNEHIYVFSTIALQNILRKNNLEIYDVENINVHGGSNRYYIKKKKNKKIKFSNKYKKNLNLEKNYGLHKFSCFKNFSKKVENSKKSLIKLLKNIKKNNKTIIGYGASAKAVTILNYCNLKENYFDFFYDTTKQKIGKFLPGTKIKVLKYKKLKNTKTYVFLGAWNFYKEIMKKENYFFANSGKFITHIPHPRIIEK
tara:strand:- start:1495 stop:2670 length:1176 start_codon:yes stop_codon:yes gene_type:complete